MKCKNCRYLGKETFENTTLRTCNVLYYLIQKYNKENNKKVYSTRALKSEDDICEMELELDEI